MLYKKLVRHDGDVIFVNIGQALSFRRDGDVTIIVFPGLDDVRVQETPEQILLAPAA